MRQRRESRETSEARHPIGVVSTRTGLPQDVLRAWERRYSAVVPHRTETGRRLYSDRDIEKLRLLRRAVESGRRISDVAGLSPQELRQLVREDVSAAPPDAAPPDHGEMRSAEQYVEAALSAIERLDGDELDRLLRRASADVSTPALRTRIVRPILETLGARWRDGSMRIVNEHLATAALRSFLGALRRNGHDPGAGTIIVTTPAGQRHELGALLASLAALEVGWEAVYLGPDLPAAEIAAAVRQRNAAAVALSLVCPAHDPAIVRELQEIRHLVGTSVRIFVGGRAAASYDDALGRIGAVVLNETDDLRSALESI
jgi:DNA-binding transcriptional MerR regulator/methylmalonyl-CoA mutase cobalamin-binding subunit